jgi:hypothetical protein
MAPKIHKTSQPVLLDGFQAILKPSEFGYALNAVLTDESLIDTLETERQEQLDFIKGKIKNQKRAVLKPEPWEEVAEGQYKIKFGWDGKSKPSIVDSLGTAVTDENIKIYSGSKVRLMFVQKPYLMKDGITYGTSVKLSGIQIISIASSSGTPSLTTEEAAEMFGTFDGGFSVEDLPPAGVDEEEPTGDEPAEDSEF